ncbi:hypothetical protein HK100_001768 [Physocladia obscura]|uniref:Mitochondrial import receptor subunit tom22 n=1 Tax=Physocladia obscura TaxID=109957 RepID=A0AAD5XEA2_9FUNG|nr:hypothetical protein HK100_001768 [Physocladia obscura]
MSGQEVSVQDETERDEDYLTEGDTESEGGDGSESEFGDETLGERLWALVDIVPPTVRVGVAAAASRGVGAAVRVGVAGGKALWVVATAALLVLMPVALELERESFAVQQENLQRVQAQQAQQLQAEVVAPPAVA